MMRKLHTHTFNLMMLTLICVSFLPAALDGLGVHTLTYSTVYKMSHLHILWISALNLKCGLIFI